MEVMSSPWSLTVPCSLASGPMESFMFFFSFVIKSAEKERIAGSRRKPNKIYLVMFSETQGRKNNSMKNLFFCHLSPQLQEDTRRNPTNEF